VPAKEGTLHRPQRWQVSVNIFCATKCTYLGVMMSHTSLVPRHKLPNVPLCHCSHEPGSAAHGAGPNTDGPQSLLFFGKNGRNVPHEDAWHRLSICKSNYLKLCFWHKLLQNLALYCTMHTLHRPSRRICLATSCSVDSLKITIFLQMTGLQIIPECSS